jgi:hypothetical protein
MVSDNKEINCYEKIIKTCFFCKRERETIQSFRFKKTRQHLCFDNNCAKKWYNLTNGKKHKGISKY